MDKKLFIAKVSDNKDPDKMHRTKVTFIDENTSVTNWLSVSSPKAGNKNGILSLPDIDEQVIVLSMDKRNARHCVLGSIWSEKSTPPKTEENAGADLNQDGKNSLDFIKSKSGNMFVFDDSESKEKIQMIASGKKTRIELSKKDELIDFETDKDIRIKAKSKITISAEEIKIEAKKN